MGKYIPNPIYNPGCQTGDRVRYLTGISFWPKGLNWYAQEVNAWTTSGRRKKIIASYSIKSKGRTGAKARAQLMARRKFAVDIRS